MIKLSEYRQLQLAESLTHAGLRLSVIRAMTDVSILTLRQWWKDVHGIKPPNGKLPESVHSYIRNKDAAARLSSFVALYKKLNGNTNLTTEGLLTAWQEFERLSGKLDINAGYYTLRDIKAHIISLSRCNNCSAFYIYDIANKHTRQCPYCGIKSI